MPRKARSVGDLARALAQVAPPSLAADWDNVGLLAGDANSRCERVLLTIDLTEQVAAEAIDLGVHAVVAYHPPLFDPIKRLVRQDPATGAVAALLLKGIALLSPHTALDSVSGGINDWLIEGIGDGLIRPLQPSSSLSGHEAFKIVVFTPSDAVERIRGAMAIAGAGRIGAYSQCSTTTAVEGTFFGSASTRPRVGRRGKLERVPELRLEMVCGTKALPAALEAARSAHPYETPAIEVHALAEQPNAFQGQGRAVHLSEPQTTAEIAQRLRRHLPARRLEAALVRGSESHRHEVVAVCAGAGMGLMRSALEAGATLFFTGEARHHEQLAAVRQGCSLLLSGHTISERGYLPRLAERLARQTAGTSFTLSKADRHPLVDA
jgi:dinuclear metal center YbgI/SA1388 family protein